MYISNSSMLPFGWTAETLMHSHSSKPFNPDIARVFYWVGYIESWGRGIQKICDACKVLGADESEYIVHGGDIMLKFNALQSAKVSEIKITKGQNEPLAEPIKEPIEIVLIEILRKNPNSTYDNFAKQMDISRSTVKRTIKLLVENQQIERIGGRCYGYWKINV